ncbi:MAG: hypothetical protein JXR37_32280 [Kiritimatiellae bacterium]|nr:hypothetical protein [Kiritimatiellia bacterium]
MNATRRFSTILAALAAGRLVVAVFALETPAGEPSQDFSHETAYELKAFYGGANMQATRTDGPGPSGKPILNVKFMSTGENSGVDVAWSFPEQALDGKTFCLHVRVPRGPVPYLRCTFLNAAGRRVSRHGYFQAGGSGWRTYAFPFGRQGGAPSFQQEIKTPGAWVCKAVLQFCGHAGKSYEIELSDFSMEGGSAQAGLANAEPVPPPLRPAVSATVANRTVSQDFSDNADYEVAAFYGGANVRSARVQETGPTGKPVLNLKFLSTGQNSGVNVSWPFPALALDGQTFQVRVRPRSKPLPFLRCTFTDDTGRRISHHIFFHTAAGTWRTYTFPFGRKGEANAFESAVKGAGTPVSQIVLQFCGTAAQTYEVDISDFSVAGVSTESVLPPPEAIPAAHDPAKSVQAPSRPPQVIQVGERDVQAVIDGAPPHSTVVADRTRVVTLSASLAIDRPLTLKGLNARLAERVANTDLLFVCADGVCVADFTLAGNLGSVSQAQRASLVTVLADDFLIENGVVSNSTRHGVLVSAARRGRDVRNGVVRNIEGYNIGRDVVSIEGGGEKGVFVRDVRVENIKGCRSLKRGTVEVCDGCENVTVSNVYGEATGYGVDVQDHRRKGQVNRHITVTDVHVKDSACAVRTVNHPLGHDGLTIRNVLGEGKWDNSDSWRPVHVQNTANVVIENVRIRDYTRPHAVLLRNCDTVAFSGAAVENSRNPGPAVLIADCNDVRLEGAALSGVDDVLETGILCRIDSSETFRNLRIHGVRAPGAKSAGILLDRGPGGGTLDGYVVTGNVARVVDRIRGRHAVVAENRPEGP